MAGARGIGGEMQLLTRASAVDLTGERPALMLEGGREEVDVLIGSDGLHSTRRAALNGPSPPVFTPQVAWRRVIAEPSAGGPVGGHV